MSKSDDKNTKKEKPTKDSGITVVDDGEDAPNHKKRKAKNKKSGKIIAFGKNKKTPNSVGIAAAVIIFLFVFIIADVGAGGFLAEVNGKFISTVTRRSAAKFSVSAGSDGTDAFLPYGSGFAVLSSGGVSYVKSSGKQYAKQQFSYGSPDMSVCGKITLVFDRGNTNYALLSSGSLYSSQSMNNNIIDAAAAKNGNYVITVSGENAKTVLYGFDSTGKTIYQWTCGYGYIAGVAISPSGDKAAVLIVNSENAVLSSKILMFDFDYDTAFAEHNFNDEIVADMKFLSSSKLLIVSEHKVYTASKGEAEEIYNYQGADIAFTDLHDGDFSAVVTDDVSRDDSYTLALFGKNGKLLCTAPLSGKVRGVSSSDKSVSVLFADKTETYSRRGKLVGTVTGLKHYNNIVLNGNYIYLMTSDLIKKYPAYGTVSAADTVTEEVSG